MKIATSNSVNKATLISSALALSTLAGLVVVGCNKPGENAKKSVPGSMEYNYAYDKREVFLADASNDLVALNRKINELSDQAATAAEAFKTNAQPKLQELRNQRVALVKQWDALNDATETNWSGAKSNYMKSYDAAAISCQQAWQWLTNNVGL
jgi:hypothetical protein